MMIFFDLFLLFLDQVPLGLDFIPLCFYLITLCTYFITLTFDLFVLYFKLPHVLLFPEIGTGGDDQKYQHEDNARKGHCKQDVSLT